MPEWFDALNSYAWVTANLLVLYIGAVLIVFVTLYYLYFDTKATTAGRFVFRFAFSLIGIIGLVFIGFFVTPVDGREWFNYPGDTIWWRPLVRLLVYGYIAFTTTALTALIHIRKWHPDRLRTQRDREMLSLRRELERKEKERNG